MAADLPALAAIVSAIRGLIAFDISARARLLVASQGKDGGQKHRAGSQNNLFAARIQNRC